MDFKAHGNIRIGKGTEINHRWCILFGDHLHSSKDYDIQISKNVTLPMNLRNNDLQTMINKSFEAFKAHALSLPDQGIEWINEASMAMVQIMMALGKTEKCMECLSILRQSIFCTFCYQTKYCSEECQKNSNHKQECLKVEVRPRDQETDFYKNIKKLEGHQPIWLTPPEALDQRLVATKNINEGEIVTFFQGKLLTQEEASTTADALSSWYYPIGTKLFFPSKEDLATKAMDPSFTIETPRVLMEVLSSPFSMITTFANLSNIIPTGSGSVCNTAIVADVANGRLALIATRKINKNEEIFFHRGFSYHFRRETDRGWLVENDCELPLNIYSSPGFKEYVILYYPFATDLYIFKIPDSDNFYSIQIYTPLEVPIPKPEMSVHFEVLPDELKSKGRVVTLIMPDYRKLMG